MNWKEEAKALDEARENENLGVIEDEEIDDSGGEDNAPRGAEQEDEPKGDPPGYMGYDEWVAAGKDPDLYKGKKAYEMEYARIQENKELKSDLKEVKGDIRDILGSMDEWKSSREQELRAELENELRHHIDNDNAEKALETKQKLDEMDATRQPEAPQIHPTVAELISETPLVDKEHDDYNVEFAADFEGIYDTLIGQLTMGGTKSISDAQIKRAWNKAVADAKGLHPDLFESPRRNRQSGGKNTQHRQDSKVNLREKVSSVKIDTKHSSINRNAATEVYDRMKEKYGEEAANNFASRLTAEG